MSTPSLPRLLGFTTLFLLSFLLLVSPAHSATTVSVRWDNITAISKTITTLQLVINPLILRDSPIHDEVYRTLELLHTRHARYASWFPYPLLSVPEIDPPSGLSQCKNVAVDFPIHLSCVRGGGVIDTVEFASFGLPGGQCRSFTVNQTCDAKGAVDVVKGLCVGKQNCTVPATIAAFGDPCPSHQADYRLAVQVTCNPPQNNTYWNLTYFDPPVEDFLMATRGGDPLMEFCTSPSWLYDQGTGPLHHYPDDPHARDFDYNTGTRLLDPTCQQIGQFYGRLAAWYSSGGLYDEYGYFHASPHHYQLGMWEVLNEMERNTDIREYTCIYDAVVKYVRMYADPQHQIEFVALAEEDPSRYSDYSYFLNASNHAPDTPLDWISYHRYAGSASRTNITDYESFFANYDDFFGVVAHVETQRKALSPTTKTTIDEIGVILPNDNDDDAAPFPVVYFNAVSAAFAYLFGNLALQGIDVLGSSQLVGYPKIPELFGGLEPQYPSVTMVNWTTGVGTARVWLLQLLGEEFRIGDQMVQTTVGGSTDVYAQGFQRKNGTTVERRVLIVNKRSVQQVVDYAEAVGGESRTVDERSGETPARREKISTAQVTLAPFAVSVFRLPTATPQTERMELTQSE